MRTLGDSSWTQPNVHVIEHNQMYMLLPNPTPQPPPTSTPWKLTKTQNKPTCASEGSDFFCWFLVVSYLML